MATSLSCHVSELCCRSCEFPIFVFVFLCRACVCVIGFEHKTVLSRKELACCGKARTGCHSHMTRLQNCGKEWRETVGKSGSSYKWVLVSEEWGGMGRKKWEELQVGACLGRMERKIEKKWEQLQVGASLTRMGGKKRRSCKQVLCSSRKMWEGRQLFLPN